MSEVGWLAIEMSRQRDVCALLGPAGLARVRVVTPAVSSAGDLVVER